MTARSKHAWRLAGLAAGCAALLLAMAASILLGVESYRPSIGWAAAFHYDETVMEQMIIRTTRMPRAFLAAAVGAGLAVAGALMQALTRNPLASPGTLGVNAGASFVVVLASVVFSVTSMQALMWLSFCGAALGAIAVYLLGSLGRGGLSPMKLVLAGAALTALFSSFTQGILALDKQGLGSVLFWLTGTIAGREPDMLIVAGPYMALGGAAAWLLSRQLDVLAMGEETARGLGQRTAWLKAGIGLIVLALAGGAVSIAGPIGFIGVVVPHMARFLAGLEHRWVLPYCAVLGAVLLVAADLAARFLMMPEEVPVGVMTALIGVPFFIYIARRGTVRS
ncbi:iron complex transport system permease protein [Paenibacillus sp. UNCCL117]|uniref:FecCD family ABC transporter permease n=1 Tax=unclassified Paenibacillus TaxID=185978 RepID=UPI0008846DC8|nr:MULTISPECIES: iron ABC transporter permease [unclassified Paenibacillus]SDE19204.1 iron complex transport system permease protein [Paenibacillus sp. cl123]SFW62057.1 iron complex transport system permease protein [Paenibacillus sp. UNCCL117]